MRAAFTEAKIIIDGDQSYLCLGIPYKDAKRFCDTRKQRLYDVEIKEHREKRSLTANGYAWVLLDKLAEAIGSTKEELYRDAVKAVGPFRDFTLTDQEAKTFATAWEMLGTGWITERVDFDPDGDLVVVRAYYGSSTYNTKQMARLIDNIIEECEAVGVETLSPDKLALLMADWGSRKGA